MEQDERRKFLFLIIEKCEAADPEIRLRAARVLLYLVQGIHYQYLYHAANQNIVNAHWI